MKKDILRFIEDNHLRPFGGSSSRVNLRTNLETKDSKLVLQKVLNHISRNFRFNDTKKIWELFSFGTGQEINRRQKFFKSIKKSEILDGIKEPEEIWKQPYSFALVTEDDEIYRELKKSDVPVHLLQSNHDLHELESYDVVKVLGVEVFACALENMSNTVFIDDISDVFLENNLMNLSGWIENIGLLMQIEDDPHFSRVVELKGIIDFKSTNFNKDDAQNEVERLNSIVQEKLKNVTISGESLLTILSEKHMPIEIENIVKDTLDGSSFPKEIFEEGVPIKIDEIALDELINDKNVDRFNDFCVKISKFSDIIKKADMIIRRAESLILLYDFYSAIDDGMDYPKNSDELSFVDSGNFLLKNPQPISFSLDDNNRCSLLTGANSGGKTTLLEHVLQLYILFNLGLPCSGKVNMRTFGKVYYFAKNKGSASKGAFETLLTQIARIRTKDSLILADEIESVTEPGMAANIICSTADYFIRNDCFLIISTHLGQEIVKSMPEFSRIDGINAKGLDEKFDLIVDHNPVLGKLANSTPELIIKRLTNTYKNDYFDFLEKKVCLSLQ